MATQTNTALVRFPAAVLRPADIKVLLARRRDCNRCRRKVWCASAGFFLVLPLLFTGCVIPSLKTFSELDRLRTEIVKAYGEEGVNVRLQNSNLLVITFSNSLLNSKDELSRINRAKETALLVKNHYRPIDSIHEIWIGFVKQETRYGFFSYNEGLGFYGFDGNAQALDASQPGGDPNSESQPLAVYSAARKQTDISITRVQLDGDLNDGLALVPHFTVPGNATRNKSTSLPSIVSFDFASYSKKQNFPGEITIAFKSDGKIVFKSTGLFEASKLEGGEYSEFFHLSLSYPEFRQLTEGRSASILLGTRVYQLTKEQLDELREMRKYVQE